MNVSLTPQLEKLVAGKVRGGLYNSASEVVREALRLLHERDQVREQHLAELRKQVAVGIEQADRGQTVRAETPEQLRRLFERVKSPPRRRPARRGKA